MAKRNCYSHVQMVIRDEEHGMIKIDDKSALRALVSYEPNDRQKAGA